MGEVDNRTPFAADGIWGRNKDGVHEWIVVVKGTFQIKRDGTTVLAEKQLEPLLLPEFHGEPGMSSIRYEADLVSPKPTTDVLTNGTAFAPKGRPSVEFLVSARIDRLHKEIKVIGNRAWKKGAFGLGPSAIEPITQVPIIYERAYGGADLSDPDPKNQQLDTRNPVGCGLVAQEGQPLPNFEYPLGSLKKSGPAGFGALASYWSPRRELQGTYDESWQKSRFPLLPLDWDPRSLLCSPKDQRPEQYLRGGESVALENLTPEGKLCFTLPKIYLYFRTHYEGISHKQQSRLITVVIEPDFPRVMMVWQTSLTVPKNSDSLDVTIVSEKLRI